jgi:hypothetical protein
MIMTYIPAAQFSTPSNDEIALIAIMRADAAVWAERNTDDEADANEVTRREKIRAYRRGKKQSPETIAKKVAGFKAARRARRDHQLVTVSPVTQPRRRTSYG